jgi:hypothetical protein
MMKRRKMIFFKLLRGQGTHEKNFASTFNDNIHIYYFKATITI